MEWASVQNSIPSLSSRRVSWPPPLIHGRTNTCSAPDHQPLRAHGINPRKWQTKVAMALRNDLRLERGWLCFTSGTLLHPNVFFRRGSLRGVFLANPKPELSVFSPKRLAFFFVVTVEDDFGMWQTTAGGQAEQISDLLAFSPQPATRQRGRHFIRPETLPRAASSLLPSTSPWLRRVPSLSPSLFSLLCNAVSVTCLL